MPADAKLEKRTIRHALFTYALPGGGEAIAFRGETVELVAADIERGEKFGAFTDKVGEKPEPSGSSLPDYPFEGDQGEEVSEAEQDAWVKSATIEEIMAAVDARPEIAESVLAAEQRRDDNARKTLLEALAQFTARS